MQTDLSWRKQLFSNNYNIFRNGEQIGILKDRSFSQTAIGQLLEKEYSFKTKGFLKQHTEIIDGAGRVIGTINFNNWMTKATILINGKVINWKYENAWNTKWSIFDKEGIKIKYSGSSSKGRINSNTDDSLLVLTGLFVTNYYWQTTIVTLVAVFIPIWITIFN